MDTSTASVDVQLPPPTLYMDVCDMCVYPECTSSAKHFPYAGYLREYCSCSKHSEYINLAADKLVRAEHAELIKNVKDGLIKDAIIIILTLILSPLMGLLLLKFLIPA